MVQLDGSHHDWFEGRRGKAVLMVMVDDATNHTRARFSEAETTRAAYDVLEGWVGKHGLPGSLYVDRDSIYAVSASRRWPSKLLARSRGRSLAEPWSSWGWK